MRKNHIAEATWRVIIDQGMKGATVRNIASEAGLSLGALRHYFSTQDELLDFAMNLVKERANARIDAIIKLDLPPKEKVVKILLQLVPVDAELMAEMEVWFAFTFHNKYAKKRIDAQSDGIFAGISNLIAFLARQELLIQDADQTIEAERLYALVDGLAVHALLEPERLDRERVIEVITQHIDSICNE